ncbi:retron system putative HNH endonuclease [Pseudanabaena sp. ABRG5-3]|uniref:retron system putative HNH endonuclease n=1 Tax=Pseudanabaena sp. ABRG5-3 TaxID=685565 RepID=UPI000DC6D410|nr:retron system putative HNH endonuclease [Pseudanabaena sp. ABRG5-3]BBC25407.1 hypothetical protein ABRG53_3150 [Pseudanabaena sp. ABRG5-3]
MKYIPKNPNREPESVKQWKQLAANDPNYGYEYLRSKERKELLQALIEEQGYICCYCGMEISDQKSHIEHLIPQSIAPDLSLEYMNLLASCGISDRVIAENREITHCEEHCGRKRGNLDLTIKPIDPNCETKFSYTAKGEILPNNDPTVIALNLNHTTLKKDRAKAIEPIINMIESGSSDEEILLFARDYEQKHDGKFKAFCFAITYFSKQYS